MEFTKHGGRRAGAGRKPGSGRFGEETKVIRVPVSYVEEVKKMLLQFPNKIKPEPGSTKATEVFWAGNQHKKVTAPLYISLVAAGLPAPAEDYTDSKMDLNEHLIQNPESTFYIRVTGDSMIDAGINPGDLLVVDRAIRPSQGRIVIAVVNGELTVKRLFKETGKVFLMPENPNYPAIEITEETDFMTWGVVTSVIHKL